MFHLLFQLGNINTDKQESTGTFTPFSLGPCMHVHRVRLGRSGLERWPVSSRRLSHSWVAGPRGPSQLEAPGLQEGWNRACSSRGLDPIGLQAADYNSPKGRPETIRQYQIPERGLKERKTENQKSKKHLPNKLEINKIY